MSDIKPEISADRPKTWLQYIRTVGPAIIVASVVLGPGSILTNSKVGWQFGYDAVWVLLLVVCFMMVMTNLSMRVGVGLVGSPCDEVRSRVGRPLAIVIGLVLFLIAGSFQFSNNLGILFAIEPFLEGETEAANSWSPSLAIALVMVVNAAVISSLLLARNLYSTIEKAMKGLVTLMLLAFAANLMIARPSVSGILTGLVPTSDFFEIAAEPEALLPLLGVIATTFSVAGAFYQAYLVKQRNWRAVDLATGTVDSIMGITTLGLMSLMIMATAAAAFHGKPEITALTSAADVAEQLRPLFGPLAVILFCSGILAGALSSFLVNAMIGGCVLSDGLGFGFDINDRMPRLATIACLLFGMVVAIAIKAVDFDIGSLIVFAQSLTVIGNPLLAGTILWLVTRREIREKCPAPKWLLAAGGIAFITVLLLSARTVWQLTQ